jgi:NADPH:quinone reductase-like Zn-dependent oxidoreductase
MVERTGHIVARGAIAREPGRPATIEEFSIDEPGPGEALVRILASGVCHTDLSAKNGVFGTEDSRFCSATKGAPSSSGLARAWTTSPQATT